MRIQSGTPEACSGPPPVCALFPPPPAPVPPGNRDSSVHHHQLIWSFVHHESLESPSCLPSFCHREAHQESPVCVSHISRTVTSLNAYLLSSPGHSSCVQFYKESTWDHLHTWLVEEILPFVSVLIDTKAWTFHPLPKEYAGGMTVSLWDGRD